MIVEKIEEENLYNIGICLSGGGALGLAHIGVLQALEENGIFADIISGSSMGSIVGVLYAAGYPPKEMEKIIVKENLSSPFRLFDFRLFSRTGFSSHQTLRLLLQKYVPENDFAALKKKLAVCAVNLNKGKWEIIDSGKKLHEYIIASSSIPMIYEVQEIEGQTYVDGGVLNNLPVDPLKPVCRRVIGIDVVPYVEQKSFDNKLNIMSAYIYLQNHNNSRKRHELCDDLIFINSIEKYHAFSFSAYKEIIQAGYDCTKKYLKSCLEP
jgi:NTE family protein